MLCFLRYLLFKKISLVSLLRKIRALFRKEKLDAEMAEEMRQHLERRTQANFAAGMSPDEARYAAQRSFGGVDQLKEVAREQRGWRWFEELAQDFRYAVRQLRRSPGFSATAVLTLGLGISLFTVQSSFIYGALLKGLPFEGSRRIHAIGNLREDGSWTFTSMRQFVELRTAQTGFDAFAAYQRDGANVSGENIFARRYASAAATAEMFSMTGVPPFLGRTLQPEDNRDGAPRVMVLSYTTWQEDFSGDAAVIGRSVRVNNETSTIIGVMPAGFHFPLAEEMWTNLRVPSSAGQAEWFEMVSLVGRLRPGVGLNAAKEELAVLLRRVATDAAPTQRVGVRPTVVPYVEEMIGAPFSRVLWALVGLVGLVLLLACLNVANLIHARALRQQHELAIRAALGAGRRRMMQPMLCLSTLLAGLGSMAGVLMATWAVAWLNPFLAGSKIPYWVHLEINGWLLLGVAALTFFVGLFSGLWPALRAPRLAAGLRDGGAGAISGGAGRAGKVFSFLQIVLSSALLVVAAVLSRGAYDAGKNNYPGDSSRMLIVSCPPVPGGHESRTVREARWAAMMRELFKRVSALPGVKLAVVTDREPAERGFPTPIEIAGKPKPAGGKDPQYASELVSPEYFEVFGLRALRGRLFTPADATGAEPVVVINESAAKHFRAGEDPIGELLRIEERNGPPVWRTVVGVVPDLPVQGVEQGQGEPGIYVPVAVAETFRLHFLLRTSVDARTLVTPVRKILRELAPDQSFKALRTLEQSIDERLRMIRLLSGFALVFGVAGGLLAAVGTFGVVGFFVEQRQREFGVRLALGARPAQIVRLVLHRGIVQLALGLALGLFLGWALNTPFARLPMLRAIARADAPIFVTVTAVVAASVLLACWLPARRAARVDPMVALRCE
ncbi:MAG: ADOP family duplicated permease [Opitutaceae bacterium]